MAAVNAAALEARLRELLPSMSNTGITGLLQCLVDLRYTVEELNGLGLDQLETYLQMRRRIIEGNLNEEISENETERRRMRMDELRLQLDLVRAQIEKNQLLKEVLERYEKAMANHQWNRRVGKGIEYTGILSAAGGLAGIFYKGATLAGVLSATGSVSTVGAAAGAAAEAAGAAAGAAVGAAGAAGAAVAVGAPVAATGGAITGVVGLVFSSAVAAPIALGAITVGFALHYIGGQKEQQERIEEDKNRQEYERELACIRQILGLDAN